MRVSCLQVNVNLNEVHIPEIRYLIQGHIAAAGCDDAAVGIGQKGRIALEFTRKARTAADAILGCSRQYARKVMISSGSTFPAPVHDGNPSLWRLAKVLAWAEARGNAVDRPLLAVARAAQQVNLPARCATPCRPCRGGRRRSSGGDGSRPRLACRSPGENTGARRLHRRVGPGP